MNRSYDSSPDPLALSTNENKVKAMRKTPQKEPLTATSPSKQNSKFSLAEMDFSSPSKSMLMSTPRMGNASPWRIKVTVQAEPGSDEENGESPSVKRVTKTKTTTTTIPLKDAATQSPVKRPRGRPRKSDIGEAAKPKWNGTPIKRAARSRSRETGVGAIESSAADIDTDVPPKKRRGRPRKSIQTPLEIEYTHINPAPEDQSEPLLDATPAHTAKRNAMSSRKNTRFANPQVPSLVTRTAVSTLPVLDTPLRAEMGKAFRTRKGTPHSKKVLTHVSSDDHSGGDGDVLTPSSGEDDEEHQETARKMSYNAQAATGRDNFDEIDVQALEEEDDDDDDDVQDMTNFALEEGTTRMLDDTTVLDSENFSMISVASLPSNRGGLSSPPKPEDLQAAVTTDIGSLLQHEYLRQSRGQKPASGVQVPNQPSPAPVHGLTDLVSLNSTLPSSRYETPVIDTDLASVPPAIQSIQPPVSKTETPLLGRAVTAGVVLQGVLDPTRLTPLPSQEAPDDKHDELNDLFRGFSEGTRKELQAGLRLGEQLAQDQAKEQSSPRMSSPTKALPPAAPKESIHRTQRKYRQSRLLTPEEQNDHATTRAEQASEVDDVRYPSLRVTEAENPLLSPSESGGEMSWHADTLPVTTTSDHREPLHDSQIPVVAEASKDTQQDDYSDIWQEEASRSSSSLEAQDLPLQRHTQLQDLFEDDGPIKPARGKLPRTWRRKSANHFQYSDEADSPQQLPLPSAPVVEPLVDRWDKGKAKVIEMSIPIEKGMEDEAVASDGSDDSDGTNESDDTGMFFQSNMPSVFTKKRSSGPQQQKDDKQSLSSLLKEGESLLPESSPPVVTKTNPFLDTPPRFSGFPSSPKKSSPLRKELLSVDFSSDSPRRFEDESTLPLAQSSPFHTFVDGQSALSAASDQRQFRVEMEGSTASTILRVRSEANKYLNAYEPQERSLDEIEEVTEPSRTWHQDLSNMESSPPRKKQGSVQSMLSPSRRPVPLFSNHKGQGQADPPKSVPTQEATEDEDVTESSTGEDTEASATSPSKPNTSTKPAGTNQQQQPSLFGRATSTLLGLCSRPAPPLPHPILSKLTPLPKVEPWTKTHYKALDKLYTTHLKHPTLFSTSSVPETPLSRTNSHFLTQFLATNKKPYVGATFSAWGYSMLMTEDLVVLCAVYMQLLRFEGIDEYERVSGRKIQMGDCGPGRSGDAIKGDDVMRRLATVVMGEAVRRDEKAGKKIDRRGALTVEWPQ